MGENMKIFLVTGTNQDEYYGGYGAEAHIVYAASMERAIDFFFGSKKDFEESGFAIEEIIIPDHEDSECVCAYYE